MTIVGYEDGMSPGQLEDELDAAGLKVMEVGDISPPIMEAWLGLFFYVENERDIPFAKGGGGTLVVRLAGYQGYGCIYLSICLSIYLSIYLPSYW